MQVPTWATVIGALCILFGLVNLADGVEVISAPSAQSQYNQAVSHIRQGRLPNGEPLWDTQFELEWDGEGEPPDIEEVLEQLREDMGEPPWEVEVNGKTVLLHPDKALDFLESQLQYPSWYLKWARSFAAVSILIALAFLLTGLLLSLAKPIAISMAYAVFGLSIVWSGLQITLYSQAGSGILFAHVPGLIGGLAIDVIFLAIILAADKSAFASPAARI